MIKFDWFQTKEKCVITILIKNITPDSLKVDISTDTLNFYAETSSEEKYTKSFHLLLPVSPSKSAWSLTKTKLEIHLIKKQDIMWPTLERCCEDPSTPSELGNEVKEQCGSQKNENSHLMYPSSSRFGNKDWNAIEKKLEDCEDEEDDVTKLFKKIYSEGSDDVKKAMNKSFSESGGTVLSTSWNQIKVGNVQAKPPDGTEYKRF